MEQLNPEQIAAQLDDLLAVGASSVERGLAQASGGNLSVRTGPDQMYVTGKGTWLDRLRHDHFAVLDLQGGITGDTVPSSEWKLHSAIYLKRPDARAEIRSARPGIPAPAAIAFRTEQDVLAAADDPERHYVEVILPQKVAMYLDYVRTRTFVGDLRVILRTFTTIARS